MKAGLLEPKNSFTEPANFCSSVTIVLKPHPDPAHEVQL